jgi:AcrR family transcriptional regulator
VSTGTRKYDSSTRQADAQSRRTAIVEAAARLFLANGYAETTITQVAAEAGVSAQLVYAAFGGKAGLLWGALDRLASGDDEPILMRDRPESLALADITDPHERMRAAAALVADLNARVGPLVKLLYQVAGSDPAVAQLDAQLLEAQREDYLVIAERLASGMRPELGPERVADVARMLCGVHVWHGLVVEGGWTQEQYADWLGDALIRMLVLDVPTTAKPPRRRR